MKKGIVIIDGAEYPVGAQMPGGFTVVVPQRAWLDARALADVLSECEKTLKKTSGEHAYRELKDFSESCLQQADGVAIEVVACRKINKGQFSCKCFCLCGEEGKIRTFSSDLIKGLELSSLSQSFNSKVAHQRTQTVLPGGRFALTAA